jgi:hypothetical protein
MLPRMAKRTVKSLNQTGRVSRARLRAAVIALKDRSEREARPRDVVIERCTTASGRKQIAFAWAKPKAAASRRAARKRG